MKALVPIIVVMLAALAPWQLSGADRPYASASQNETLEFAVDFLNPDGSPHCLRQYCSTGTLTLTDDNTLRWQLSLVGFLSSAELRRTPAQANAKPVLDLGPALIVIHPPCLPLEECLPDFTAFFGEATLSDAQVMHLLRGRFYVGIDGGEVIGIITPQ